MYQQHWWRCNGPCHKKAPYFGTVRRAINRAPGPSDFWWMEHQQSCGGQFIKIKEPENFKTKNTKNNQKSISVSTNTHKENNLTKWLKNSDNSFGRHKSSDISRSKTKPILKISNTGNEKIKNIHKSNDSPFNSKINNKPLDSNLKKLGNNTNNVHGWGVGGPNSSSSASKVINNNHTPKYSYSGQLGGSKIGKSNLLDKFYVKSNNQQRTQLKQKTSSHNKANMEKSVIKSVEGEGNASQSDSSNKEVRDLVNCPICDVTVSINFINEHIDSCLDNKGGSKSNDTKNTPQQYNVNSQMDDTSSIKYGIFGTAKRSKVMDTSTPKRQKLENLHKSEYTDCSVCHRSFKTTDINNHLDTCLRKQSVSNSSSNITVIDSSSNFESSNSTSADSPSTKTNTQYNHRKTNTTNTKCLICEMIVPPTETLNEHLEECIATIFNAEAGLCYDEDDEDLERPDRRYYCPVCRELFQKKVMNEHLEKCHEEKGF